MSTAVSQQRSVETRQALLDAAERCFGEHGVEPTNVTTVAAEAGRAVGSLYHHFTDKAGLVAAVVERALHDLAADIEAWLEPTQWEGQGIIEICAAYVDGASSRERVRPGSKRILAEITLTDADVRRRTGAIRSELRTGLIELMLARSGSVGHPDPDTAIRFVVDQITAMVAARLDRSNPAGQLDRLHDERFCEELLVSVRAYLRVDEPLADEPLADEPSTDEPLADEPSTDEPLADEPHPHEPSIDHHHDSTGERP